MTEITTGTVVSPNHQGANTDWAQLRGRVTKIWRSGGTEGEQVARVIWFGKARKINGPSTDGYPLSMLSVAS